MRATVLVRPKPGSSTRRARPSRASLASSASPSSEARVGRVVDLEVGRGVARRRAREVERMCEQLLANPLIESYEIELAEGS